MRSRSSSAASVPSSPDTPEETLPIFVKLLSGETISLSLPPSTTLSTLLQLLSLRTSRPASSLRLSHAGKHLQTTLPPATQPPPNSISSTASATATTSSPSSSSSSSAPESPTLATLNLQPNSTLTLSLPLRGGMPNRKARCTFKDCRDPAQRIVGDCGFCSGHFCGKHRLLEDHKCSGLEDCKKESREQNKVKLESERTVMVRGI